MSLWDKVKTWARSVWSAVKSAFNTGDTYSDAVSNDTTNDTWKQTLNQQIANWNITNNTTNTNQVEFNWLRNLRNNLNTNEPTTPIDTRTIQATTPTAVSDKEEESVFSKIKNWLKWAESDINEISDSANTFVQNLVKNRLAKDEYNKEEEFLALWYNPDNKDVYYLDLNEDRGLFDVDWGTREWVKEEFENLLQEAGYKWETTWDWNAAYEEFYDKAKWLFRIRADDLYNNWLLSDWLKAKRRYQMYTQDQLDMLAQTGKTNKWWYEPTREEFAEFVEMYLRNANKQGELGELLQKYNPDVEQFNLDTNLQSEWMSKNRALWLKGLDEYLAYMNEVNPNAAQEARLTYSSYVLWGRLSRRYAQVAPIYRAEQEILSRDKSTWSEYDKELLEKADIARQMDTQFVNNVNDLFRQIVKYWTDKNWEIVDTPDIFENGESLNDVLTKWLRELAWEDVHWYAQHQSDLDIIQNFANEALYNYNKDKKWPLKKGWNEIEHFFEPVGSTLWEAWQAAWALGMDMVGWLSLWVLSDELTKSYMDQDATAFRLLETDDWNIKRTIKKYYLEATEYTPEVLWNLIPDILLYKFLWPWAVTTAVTKVNDIRAATSAVRAAEWVNLLNKIRVVSWLAKWEKAAEALWMSIWKYKEFINAAKTIKWVSNYQTIKTWAQLVDRMVTQLWLGQFMDAQWSAYDTEPYSQASFLMSLIWSVAFDMLPELSRLFTWRWVFGLLTGKNSIWSLARYIDSSEDAAKNIAAALRKWTKEINLTDLEAFLKSYSVIEEAAKQAYSQLTPEEKEKIWEMTKGMVYSYINQAFGSNSTIGRRVRQLIQNKNANIADVVKYIAKVPWDISLWNYVSTIRLKNWTRANIFATGKEWEYSPVLDSVLDWWFVKRITWWFTQEDLDKLSKVQWYSNIEKNKSKWFDSLETDEWTKYYLNKSWLKQFWLKPENVTLESLWITLKEAENTREALNVIKWANWVKISDNTIGYIAETWWYDEITLKVKEVLWC